MVEIRHLRYFVAVAEELNFGRAASRLHVSQPPLSRQIQQLEAGLGTLLFIRESRRIRLTDAGHQYLRDVRKLLADLDKAGESARRAARGETGLLRLGFVSTALYSILPEMVRCYRTRWPDVKLELRELTVDAQYRALEQGEIDVAMMLCVDEVPGFVSGCVHTETLLLCLPETHALAGKNASRALPLKSLKDDPFILFPRPLSPGLFDRIAGYALACGFNLKVAQEAVQMQTIVGLVSAGLGQAIVPECMAGLQRPGVTYRRLAPRPPRIHTALVWRSGQDSAPLAGLIGMLQGGP